MPTDDMGWNEGSSLDPTGGPWRAGIRRNFDISDYIPLVEIGKAVGVRFQGAFNLAEMDRLNVCAKYPTTTHQGTNWDNSANVDPSQVEMMNYIKDNSAFLEFAMHGVGHEHWENGKKTRAEWYDKENNKTWPQKVIEDHIKCFKEIMAQYGWTPGNGQSFVESFVPCAFAYYWNPESGQSTGTLMYKHGIKYINTVFSNIPELNPPVEAGGGFDSGAHVLDRTGYGNDWYEPASLPKKSIDEYTTDMIVAHWVNWLATDYFLQPELNQNWIKYFKDIQSHPDHYLAKNTEQMHSQWLYNRYTEVKEETEGLVTIDNRGMPDDAYPGNLLGNMVLTLPLENGMHISNADLDGKPISAYFEDEGYGFIYLPQLKKKIYRLKYKTGTKLLPLFVNNTGTYNVYNVDITAEGIDFELKMYGTQDVLVKCPKPVSIKSSNRYLKILSHEHNNKTGMLSVKIHGRDMQGEKGTIYVKF